MEPATTSQAGPRDDDAAGEAPGRRSVAPGVVALLVLVAAGAVLAWFFWPDSVPAAPTRAWYSTDDGATFFADDARRVPPFDHGGAPAVRVHVFSCDGGKTRFAGYLQKLPDDVVRRFREQGVDPATVPENVLAYEGWLYKRPGDADWVSRKTGGAALRVFDVQCPDGRGTPAEIFPPGHGRR